jgi:hypothetical protein
LRNEIFRFRPCVRKVAASAAGNYNFAPSLRVVFQNQNSSPALARFYGAKKSRRASADNDYVKFHQIK